MDDFGKNTASIPNRAADYLVNWIMENGLKPGDKIPTELELTKILNVGRSSVREAIAILKSKNIVEVRRGCGTFLSESPGQVEDPLGLNFIQNRRQLALDWGIVRMIIEPSIAELAAIHATDEEVEELDYWNRQVEVNIAEGVSHLEADLRFHALLASATHNMVVDKLMPIINEGIDRFMSSADDNASAESRHWHYKIMDAVRAHDAAAAKCAMEMLLCVNQERLRNHFE